MVRTRLALLVVLCLVVAPAVSPSAGAGTADLTARLTKSLRSPYLALDRTGAIAVDAATGEVLFAHNETLPLVPASNEKLPVAWTALILLGPGVPVPHGASSAEASASGRPGTETCSSRATATRRSRRPDIGRLAAAVRARASAASPAGSAATSLPTTRGAAAPGWKRYFIGGESPPLSALVVDRARGWPALSPPLLAAKALRDGARRAWRRRRRQAGARRRASRATAHRASTARRALASIVRGDGPRQRQLRRGDAAQAPRDARRRGRDDRARRARRARQRCGRPASRSRASGSSTAPGCRRSTG